VGKNPQGLKPNIDFMGFIGPAEAVPLLQSLEESALQGVFLRPVKSRFVPGMKSRPTARMSFSARCEVGDFHPRSPEARDRGHPHPGLKWSHDFFRVRLVIDDFGGSQVGRGFDDRLHRKGPRLKPILFEAGDLRGMNAPAPSVSLARWGGATDSSRWGCDEWGTGSLRFACAMGRGDPLIAMGLR